MKNLRKVNISGKSVLRTRSSYVAKKNMFAASKRASISTEKHEAICSECNATCEVPFRPNGKKPIYCSNCFKAKEDSSSHTHTSTRPTSFKREAPERDDMKKQFAILNAKIDKLTEIVGAQNRPSYRTKK